MEPNDKGLFFYPPETLQKIAEQHLACGTDCAALKDAGIIVRPSFLEACVAARLVEWFGRLKSYVRPQRGDNSLFTNRQVWVHDLPPSEAAQALELRVIRRRALATLVAHGHPALVGSDGAVLNLWCPGQAMQIHSDDVGPHSVHRKYTSIVYLNDRFEGGELFFPLRRTSLKITTGMLVMFPCAELHGVNPIRSGHRFTFSTWFTDDASFADWDTDHRQ